VRIVKQTQASLLQALHAGVMKAEQPVVLEYEAIAPLCITVAALQHHNLLTPRDASALLRHVCFYTPGAFDPALGDARGDTLPAERGCTELGMAPSPPPGSPRQDTQFASPGAAPRSPAVLMGCSTRSADL
jgi:hypothetical protein